MRVQSGERLFPAGPPPAFPENYSKRGPSIWKTPKWLVPKLGTPPFQMVGKENYPYRDYCSNARVYTYTWVSSKVGHPIKSWVSHVPQKNTPSPAALPSPSVRPSPEGKHESSRSREVSASEGVPITSEAKLWLWGRLWDRGPARCLVPEDNKGSHSVVLGGYSGAILRQPKRGCF